MSMGKETFMDRYRIGMIEILAIFVNLGSDANIKARAVMRVITGHIRTMETMMKTQVCWLDAIAIGLGILALVAMTLLQSGRGVGF